MFVIAFQRKVDNKYVSSSQLSRADRELVSDLEVKPKTPSTHGTARLVVGATSVSCTVYLEE